MGESKPSRWCHRRSFNPFDLQVTDDQSGVTKQSKITLAFLDPKIEHVYIEEQVKYIRYPVMALVFIREVMFLVAPTYFVEEDSPIYWLYLAHRARAWLVIGLLYLSQVLPWTHTVHTLAMDLQIFGDVVIESAITGHLGHILPPAVLLVGVANVLTRIGYLHHIAASVTSALVYFYMSTEHTTTDLAGYLAIYPLVFVIARFGDRTIREDFITRQSVQSFEGRLREEFEKFTASASSSMLSQKRELRIQVPPGLSTMQRVFYLMNQSQEINKLIIASESRQSTFLSTMSHELRTPLMGITGSTDLLKMDETLNDDAQELVEMLSNSSSQLLGIVNDILDFSKLEHDPESLQLEQSDISPHAFAHKVDLLFKHQAQTKHLAFKATSTVDASCVVVGDPLRLQQVIFNLMTNAIKFTNRGGTVSCTLSLDKEDNLVITVKDSGIGIDAEMHKSLFDPFHQSNNSITRKYGGTGLGLTITKRIVTCMHGEIDVESTPNVGSTFTVKLPLLVKSRGRDIQRREVTPPAAIAPMQMAEQIRIMVVDDSPLVQRVMMKLLNTIGYHNVEIASCGSEALQKVEHSIDAQLPFKFIFMDYHMPGMDGVACIERLCSTWKEQTPKIIGLTADVAGSVKELYVAAGAHGVVTKPIDVTNLATLLSSL